MPVRTHALSDCLLQDVSGLLEGHDFVSFRPPLNAIPTVAEPIKAIAASSLCASLMKKFIPESSDALDAVAMEKFLACNRECGHWDSTYRDDLFLPFLVGHFREEVARFWEGRFGRHPLINSYADIIDAGRFGPGVSRGARSQDFYTKAFDSDLVSTSTFLTRRWTSHMNGNPLWRVADFIRQCHGNTERVCRSSKISFVPKNDATSRTIAVEPSLNTWY